MMLTTDLALKDVDPIYGRSRSASTRTRRFRRRRSRAPGTSSRTATWVPTARYLGPEVPTSPELWQDPVPAVDHELVGRRRRRRAEAEDARLGSLDLASSSRTAWASASTYRGSTSAAAPTARGSASRRRRTGPSTTGRAGQGAQVLEGIQKEFNDAQGRQRQEDLARRPDRARRRGRRRGRREEGRSRGHGALRTGPHGRHGRDDRRAVVRRCSSRVDGFRNHNGERQRGSPRAREPRRSRAAPHADRTGDDRARSAACASSVPTPAARATACSPTGRARA